MKKRENWKLNWENPDEKKKYYADYNKAWYQRNKEARSKQIKEYSKAHPKENVARVQKYVAKNKEKVYTYNREYSKTVMGGYRTYKSVAAKKGNEFILTPEDFAEIVGQPCKYCGEDSKRIGVDRVDNSKGYTKENCAPCCKDCNYMKKNHTVEYFLNHIMKIAQYNK